MARASSASPIPRRKPRVVAFDSSFLMAVSEKPTSWFQDIQGGLGAFSPVVLASVLAELERLASRGDSKARLASVAVSLVQAGRFSVAPDGGGRPDDEMLSFALREGAAVATVDNDLASRLRASRVSTVITLRGGRVAL